MKSRGTGASQWLAWFSVLLMICAWGVINVLGDQVWWSVPILFGPRWVWGALLLGVIPYLLLRPRRGIWPMLAGGLIFTFGILDARVGLGLMTGPSKANLRVLEFNAEGDAGEKTEFAELLKLIHEVKPNLVILEECSSKLRAILARQLSEYTHRETLSLCLLSDDEVLTWEPRDPTEFWNVYGSGAIVRAEVHTSAGRLRVGLVHLATPRRALRNFNDSTKIESMEISTTANMQLRDRESAAAREWIARDDSLPTIVAGDFNIPVASAIYRTHWGDLQNALSSTGVGLVHTKNLRLWGIRIDHILAWKGVQTVRAWVGPDLGSDHLPVIADLLIPIR